MLPQQAACVPLQKALFPHAKTFRIPLEFVTMQSSIFSNLPKRCDWMMRQGWDYQQWSRFGSHAGQPGHRDGVQSNIE
jgi:hypothetical protein